MTYLCSQEPHPGINFYGHDGGCAECGYRPGDNNCDCGHASNWHDMGHGCIYCRCRGFVDTATPADTLT